MTRKHSISEITLLDLLKVSLWGTSPSVDYGALSDAEWLNVYHLAGKQGVRALTFGGISRLPLDIRLDAKLSLTWMVNSILTKQRYLHNLNITIQLNDLSKAGDMDMILLKGCALANCYPIPEYREYGDIDIYLSGKHTQGNHLLKLQGIEIKETEKHTTFMFRGIPVENHITFVDQIKDADIFCRKRKQAFEIVEKVLQEILNEEETNYLARYDIRIPSATFNFIFMVMHTGTHLGKELVLRHICDWACFLAANKGRYDEKRIKQVLDLMNFRKLCLMMTDAAIHHIGMPAEFAPSFYKSGARDRIYEKFINSLFFHFPGATEVEQNTLSCKWQRFYNNQWAYDLFYKEYLPERLCRTAVVWFKEKYNKITLNKN